MFTGIIEATGPILEIRPDGITVERPAMFDDVKVGSSISVSGACLTIVGLEKGSMRFDVVPETWAKTTLGDKSVGESVNLERAMPANGRFEGHIVQGHVEGVGVISSTTEAAAFPPPPGPLPRGGRGEFVVKMPMNRNVLHFARTMRRQPTAAENLLWDSLRTEKLDGHVFRRQHPIGLHILDFYCHAARLCIEIDGGIHQQADQKAYDQERQEFLTKEKGIRVLRLTNEDILHALPDALHRIRLSLRSSPLPSGEGSGEREGGEEGLGVEENAPVILTLRVPSNLLPFIIPKGSITIDGVALTIASVDGDLCSIALIPHTLALTTLGSLRDGDRVNIETDVLLRWLAHAHKRD